jgi:hypothetical protein
MLDFVGCERTTFFVILITVYTHLLACLSFCLVRGLFCFLAELVGMYHRPGMPSV